jgi:hypothetical protein
MTYQRMVLVMVAGAAMAAAALVPVQATGPSFQPDGKFGGSSLSGWQAVGAVDWKAQNGEITGTPKTASGGWLILEKSYQDVGFFASVKCPAGCKTGVLLRAEKTATGWKGVLMTLSEGDNAQDRLFGVTLDAEGRELTRTPLRNPGGGQIRIAPALEPNAIATAPRAGGPPAAGRAGGAGAAGAGRGAPPKLPVGQANTGFHAGEWNDLELLLDANILRTYVNNAGPQGVADDDLGRYGMIAIYAGGSAPVQFKNVGYKDLALRVRSTEVVSKNFRMQRLSDFYYSWGASGDDFNQDGVMDVVSGPHIFFGPDFTKSREIYLQLTSNPSNTFATDAWMQYSADFTGDGWPDVLNASFGGSTSGATLYVNPKGELRRWNSYRVTTSQQTEIAVLADVDGDNKPELVYGAGGVMMYAKPDPAKPTQPWIVRTVSEPGYTTAHGVGTGDVNSDGRVDILNAYGWWEQPADKNAQGPWTYHPQAFGRPLGRASLGGSVMAVYDVNGDKLNDVVTSLSAHGWGLAWYEQKKDAGNNISFVQHMIMDDFATEKENAGGVTFSQPHGSAYADVDGDGVTDFIVGKRYWSHQDTQIDPFAYGDPVLYVYRTVRDKRAPGGAKFVPDLVHNRSGVGSHLWAGDLNKDGKVDLVTPTKFGTFVFWGQK